LALEDRGQRGTAVAAQDWAAHIGVAQSDAYVPAKAAEFYYFERPDTPATVTVARYLDTLADLIADAEHRFA
jgi:hypothetical protein